MNGSAEKGFRCTGFDIFLAAREKAPLHSSNLARLKLSGDCCAVVRIYSGAMLNAKRSSQ